MSTAKAGSASTIADAQSPPRTMGFNLNIPFLHEITTTNLRSFAHTCYLPPLRWRSDRNDKANNNDYQLNC
ncbi:MAG TPA: hypothetical protein DCX28_08560 [Enterobacteriaceae bacterium]|nr:hypothetical protein [Enterobacteriaceae bacterium]